MEVVVGDVSRFAGRPISGGSVPLPDNSVESQSLRVELCNSVFAAGTAADAISELCDRHRIPETIKHDVLVALDEVISNVVKYAWPAGESHCFTVSADLGEGAIRVEIVDDGAPFNLEKAVGEANVPLGRSGEIGGLGIVLVSQTIDRINYQRADGLNRTILWKYF